jgi:hypothetical protein
MTVALEDILSNWDRLVFMINRQVLLVHGLLVCYGLRVSRRINDVIIYVVC